MVVNLHTQNITIWSGYLNIEVWNTARFSPWQNGICERNQAVADDCMQRILADNKTLILKLLLHRYLNAKTHYRWYVDSQLAFGKNPNLSSMLIDKPQALYSITVKWSFHKRSEYASSEQKAFIQAVLQVKNTTSNKSFWFCI